MGKRVRPNGSRLSCGRNAGGRKAVERQKKRTPARQRNSSLLASARQLQAHVRRRAEVSGSRRAPRQPRGDDQSQSGHSESECAPVLLLARAPGAAATGNSVAQGAESSTTSVA